MKDFRLNFRAVLGWSSVAVLLAFPVFSLSGAVDMFLKLEGIEGESQDATHGKEIDVLAWSWGASNSGTTHVGAGGGGKATVQDIAVTKYIDKSSADLMLHTMNGKHIATGQLTVRKAGESAFEYLKIELKDIIVNSISIGGSGGEDRLTENISLNFRSYRLTYTPQNSKGGADTANIKTVEWDIAENIEDF